MKVNLAVIPLVIFASVSNFQAQAESDRKTAVSQSPTSKELRRRAISVGVVNGKAINLVTPVYPRAAVAINARGAVNVRVLINEKGNVIEAKVLSGHPVLYTNSIAAALKSTFEPITLSGRKLNVWGIIVYNYSSDFFNWLEIGISFGGNPLTEMLPPGFEEEKLLYKLYQTNGYNKDSESFQKALEAIENKLSADKRNLWLFQVGMLLNKLKFGFPNNEQLKIEAANLKKYISGSPDNVSPFLMSKLNNLLSLVENPQLNTYNPQNGSKFHEQMNEINEKMFMLGN